MPDPIGRSLSIVLLGNVDREHPVEEEIISRAHDLGDQYGLDVMAASGPYYKGGDERDQEVARLTAEVVRLGAALAAQAAMIIPAQANAVRGIAAAMLQEGVIDELGHRVMMKTADHLGAMTPATAEAGQT